MNENAGPHPKPAARSPAPPPPGAATRAAKRIRQLAASEEKFHSMANSANSAIFLTDEEGLISFWNPAAERVFGWTARETLGRAAEGLLFYDPLLACAVPEPAGENAPHKNIEAIGVRKNRDLFPFELSIAAVSLHGKLHRMCIVNDITERKQIEIKLSDSEEKYRSLFEGSRDAIITLAPPAWQLTAANQAAGEIFRAATPEDLLRCQLDKISSARQPDGRLSQEKGPAVIAAALQSGSQLLEWKCRRLDGEEFFATMLLSKCQAGGRIFVQAVIRDITEQKLAELKLIAYAREVEDLYNNAPCGYHSLDEHSRIIRINDTELAWLGYSRAELIGQKITALFNAPAATALAQHWPGGTHASSPGNADLEMICRDGRRLPVAINAKVITDANGRLLRSQAMVFDVSERIRTEQALRESMRALFEANRAKTEFLANMSHEIRTPMNAIMGYAQLLQRESDLPQPIRNYINIILRSGDNLLGLLNSLLEIAKIESGRVTVKPLLFDIHELVDELVCLFHERAANKQLSLAVDKRGCPNRFLEADQEKIRQVTANLLSNAIKFTRHGGVELTVTSLPAADGQPRLRLQVADTGVGIAPEEIPALFEKFRQTSSGQRSSSGSGLGLFISRQYARAMGGEITVTSSLEKGSTFILEVPFTPVGETLYLKKTSSCRSLRLAADTPPKHIFVVDDNAENRDILQRLLETVGFSVESFPSGEATLAALALRRPDLILMDTRMPGLNGYETIRRLRTLPILPAIKVITVSAAAFENDRQDSKQAGADDFLAKPFKDEELLEKIGKLLRLRYDHEMPAASFEPDTEYISRSIKPEDLAALPAALRSQLYEALLAADFDSARRLIQEIARLDERLGRQLERLADHFDAERLMQLLQPENPLPPHEA